MPVQRGSVRPAWPGLRGPTYVARPTLHRPQADRLGVPGCCWATLPYLSVIVQPFVRSTYYA